MVVALLSGDPNMLSVAHSGKSPHLITGRLMSGLDEALIEKEDKLLKEVKDPNEILVIRRAKIPEVLHAQFLPRTMSIRQAAKKGNHGGNYKEGPAMFALTNEMDIKEAESILKRYTCQSPSHGKFGHSCGDVAYPGIRDWWDSVDAKIRKDRTLVNCFGRKVYFSGQMGEDLFKQAYSFVPQSTVFDITARGMRLFMDDASAEFEPCQIRAQVHDSLLFDYLGCDFGKMARFVLKQSLDYMSPEIEYTEKFTIRVTLKGGLVWRNLKDIEITENLIEMADRLEVQWKKAKEMIQQAEEVATSSPTASMTPSVAA